jgi:probable addiction module antidote protein
VEGLNDARTRLTDFFSILLRHRASEALLEPVQEAIMRKSKAYQAELIESLRDPREAEAYLNAALEEDDPELFLVALRNVAEAQGGVAQLADKTKLNRESLYKMLSERGNPELKSLDALLHALGFRLAVTANR